MVRIVIVICVVAVFVVIVVVVGVVSVGPTWSLLACLFVPSSLEAFVLDVPYLAAIVALLLPPLCCRDCLPCARRVRS